MKKLKLKKFFAVVTVVAMVLGMLTTVYAAGTSDNSSPYSITIQISESGHTYEAYQIFDGDLAENGQVLSNIVWGSGVDKTKVDALLTFDNHTGDNNFADAAALAKYLSDNSITSLAKAFAVEAAKYLASDPTASTSDFVEAAGETPAHYTISISDPGYYLIKDKDSTLGTSAAYTSYIIEVLGKETVDAKTSTPTLTKQVQDDNDGTWKKSADYSVNESIPYLLTATVPKNLLDYSTYKLTIHDEAADGLTINADSIVVKLDENNLAASDYTKSTSCDNDNCDFEIVITDLTKVSGVTNTSKITVEYSAKLNGKAENGSAGNSNTAWMDYPNNPYEDGNGTTTPDKTVVYTYKLVVTKRDGETENANGISANMDLLKGATFTLYKGTDQTEANSLGTGTSSSDGAVFTWSGLGDGKYTLVETTPPDGYNKVEDITFTISASHTDTELKELKAEPASGSKGEFATANNKSSISTDVIDYSGATLPNAGGMGTKLLYIIGTILVLFAGVLLIAKRRTGYDR